MRLRLNVDGRCCTWLCSCARSSPTLLVIALVLLEPLSQRRPCCLASTFEKLNTTDRANDSIPFPVAGRVIRRELSGGELHNYRIDLEEGQYLRVLVDRQSIAAVITLRGPSGEILAQVDCRSDGPTPISLIAESLGQYKLEVRSLDEAQTTGHYNLWVEKVVRLATAKDRWLAVAERSVAEAERLMKNWRAESTRKAIDKFKDSLAAWRSGGDGREEARTLRRTGDAYRPLGEYQNAVTFYDWALQVSRKLKERHGEAESLNKLSNIYLTLGENQKALKLCAQALRLSKREGDLREQALTLNNFGEIHHGLGKSPEALKEYRQALAFWQEVGDRQGQASTLLNFGYVYSDLGRVREAFDSYDRAVALWRSERDQYGETITLIAIGRLYSRLGESQQALGYFEDAISSIRLIGDPLWEAGALNGMAYIYNGAGEKPRALEYYDQALRLFRMVHNRVAEAGTLGEAGRVYLATGDNQKALEYLQESFGIFKALGARRMEIVELKDIGRVYEAQGNKRKAFEAYLRAQAFYHAEKDLRNEATALNLIGGVQEAWGQMEKAVDSYNRALPLCRQGEYPYGEATTLYNFTRLESHRGNLVAARARIESALNVIESLRSKIAGQDSRASYFASTHQYYELYVDVLMQLHKPHPAEGFDAVAFDASEKARARSLLESLTESRTDIREGADPALLERERNLEQALNAKAQGHAQLARDKNSEGAQSIAKEIDHLTTEYDEVRAQIKSKSPRYAALTQPEPLSLHEIQQQLLDDNTLLLEYMLGDDRSYVWAVTRTEVSSFELPGRARIEEAAQRFYELLKANQPVPGETFDQRQTRIAEANEHLSEAAASLSMLVLGPLTTKLGTKRLLIVPDGALQYIPFQALTVPAATSGTTEQAKTAGNPDEQIPLLVDHEIVNEPSASALALVISDTAQRKPAPNSIAVFANPVFEADDPRVSFNSPSATPAHRLSQEIQVQEAFRDAGLGEGLRIPPLPASGEEADAIMALAPRGTGFRAEGFEASRATIARPELSRYRIVHFATHGFVDYQHPELSGLVLSLVDAKGNPQDGFLRLHDIYNLNLPADLVVLSACNTGLGKDVKGEGLIGLTRGFMYAGAAGVVASLWKVDDDATAELMKQFYGGVFKKDLSPAAALREAQLAMWRQKRWHAPYYWAAFVIQGQYNQKVMPNRSPTAFQIVTLAAIIGALSLAAFLFLRRRRIEIL